MDTFVSDVSTTFIEHYEPDKRIQTSGEYKPSKQGH